MTDCPRVVAMDAFLAYFVTPVFQRGASLVYIIYIYSFIICFIIDIDIYYLHYYLYNKYLFILICYSKTYIFKIGILRPKTISAMDPFFFPEDLKWATGPLLAKPLTC